jgi:hypothetical protein
MVKCIWQLANDMMESFGLNALVNNMYAKDVNTAMQDLLDARQVALDCYGDEAIAQGMIGPTKFLPLGVCGTVSNVLCQIFLDDPDSNYRFDFENRAKENGYSKGPMLLGNALKNRSDKKSYVLRIDCSSHSYVLYLPPSKDDAYLLQGNCAACMKSFTLQEWMNSKKGGLVQSLATHYELLQKMEKLEEVVLGPRKQDLVDFFSIDNDHKTKYAAYKPGNMTAIFRSFDEKTAMANIESLYKRAGVKGQ